MFRSTFVKLPNFIPWEVSPIGQRGAVDLVPPRQYRYMHPVLGLRVGETKFVNALISVNSKRVTVRMENRNGLAVGGEWPKPPAARKLRRPKSRGPLTEPVRVYALPSARTNAASFPDCRTHRAQPLEFIGKVGIEQ